MEDPIFLDAVRETQAREGGSVSGICLKCHAPSVAVTNDHALALKATWEGVSCDICHALTSVEMSGGNPRLVLDLGPVKRGPIREAESMAHEAEFSPLHLSAEICAPCHEYANDEGTLLMTTYSEWRQSVPAKEGKTCQHCHMGRTVGQIVDPRVARLPEAQVNLHEVPGGHSIDLLNQALRIDVDLHREGGALSVMVRVENRGAGHAVPTGMPGRRIILETTVRSSDGSPRTEPRAFCATFVNASGAEIDRDSAYFAKGVRKIADTRLVSGTPWSETFRFPVSPSATAYVGVLLRYEHFPLGSESPGTKIIFYSTDRVSPPEESGGR
jgi:hypothetical protein